MGRWKNLAMDVSYEMGRGGELPPEVLDMADTVGSLLAARRTAEGELPFDELEDADVVYQQAIAILREADGTEAFRIYTKLWYKYCRRARKENHDTELVGSSNKGSA